MGVWTLYFFHRVNSRGVLFLMRHGLTPFHVYQSNMLLSIMLLSSMIWHILGMDPKFFANQ